MKGIHQENDFPGEAAVGDRGEACAEAVFLGGQQRPGLQFPSWPGNDGRHRGFGIVNEHA